MSTKNIGIREDVYERLKAHKLGDESFSETLDRILSTVDSDWRTHAGFISEEDADEFREEVERGMDELGASLDGVGDRVDEEFEDTDPETESEESA